MTNTPLEYFDLQVNGYGGFDFNQDDLSAEDLNSACRKIDADGVDGVLATIITERIDSMCRRLRRIVQIRERDPLVCRIVVGFHIEGPFVNERDGFRGAHPLDAVVPAAVDPMQRLLDAAGGLTRIVTLAPERDRKMAVTRMLARQGITVSAGHCDSSLEQLEAAIDAGLSMFTHLGNGCPMQLHRHDNIVQRALALADRLWLTFIADGVHVPLAALGNYLRLATVDRCVVVSDAVAPAGLGPGRYTNGRWNLLVGEDLVARAPDGSHFLGSAINMPRSARNLREGLGLSRDQVRRLTTINPRQAIGMPVHL